MGRTRRGTSAGFTRASSAARSSAPPPARTAPAASQSGGAGSRQPPVQNTFVHQPVYAPRGPGFLGTMAAAMGGNILGNAAYNSMFRNGEQPTTPQGVHEMKQAMDESPCAVQFDTYAKCMEHNSNDANACNWAWDSVAQCREKALSNAQAQVEQAAWLSNT